MKSVRWRQNVVRQENKPEAERFSVEDMLSRQDEKMRQDDGLNTSLTRHGQCCVAKGGGWRDENCDWL